MSKTQYTQGFEAGVAWEKQRALKEAREKTNVMEIKMTECFWCTENFDQSDHDTCPSCARDTHTKEITIIHMEDEE